MDLHPRIGGESRSHPELPKLVARNGAREIACVGLEYFCFEGDGLWSSADDELIALATRELAILGLSLPPTSIGGAVVRQEKAYPVYDEGYRDNVDTLRRS